MDTTCLHNSHDLRLPDWGPYTKKYHGISHIPDPKLGFRFDLSVFPGFYRRQVLVPCVKWESGYHPWETSPDLSYYSHRYELEWKDQVYADISFSALSPTSRLVRCEFVNNTAFDQNLVLHYMAYLNFPPARAYSDEDILPSQVILPPGALWVNATGYADLQFAVPRLTDNLVYDGWLRAEIRGHGFVNGSAIGAGFGRDQGDTVTYTIRLARPTSDSVLLIRYRAPEGAAIFKLAGAVETTIELPASQSFAVMSVELGHLAAGEHELRLTSGDGGAVELDGFIIVESDAADQVRFVDVHWKHVPQILPGPLPNSLLLKYEQVDLHYGLAWEGESFEVRELYNDELDRFLRHYVHEHVKKVLHGEGQGHFTNVFIRPIHLPPKRRASRVLYGLVCAGSRTEVEQRLEGFTADSVRYHDLHHRAKSHAVLLPTTPAGQPYVFSQARMAATLLTNVVYPVYTRRTYIRHNTPGKWWDCLYTWDSGFIGLGLLELDLDRAVDCLNAYTTPPGDTHAAFIHHGSPVPVQFYLFLELWNRTQSRELLEYFYPRLRQYHGFLAGRLGSSTTRTLKSNLLRTWDYFYNSGGWDDYPPQVHVHKNGLEASVTPVVNTAHAIRTAKILRMMAQALGQDTAEYDEDIATFGHALQMHSWDQESGYFGYVCHDQAGQPVGILRHASGANFDMGLDGAYPLVAGICTSEQESRLLGYLMSKEHMWCCSGISTVDQSAPYFRGDGYWNGAVWMPHQWFFWKTLLDLGQAEAAFRIAQTALDVWKTEVDASYNCFEHFIVQSGRGAGWHQFGGLSAPVLSWFGAYHRPGRLTCGLDVWVARQQFSDDNRKLVAVLQHHAPTRRAFTMIAAMSPAAQYRLTWNGQDVAHRELFPGVFQITLDEVDREGTLEVWAVAEQD